MRSVDGIRHHPYRHIALVVPAWFNASVPDGRVQVDERGLVKVQDVDAVFMSGQDDIVRYHPNGITVSKGESAGDPVRTRTGGWRASTQQFTTLQNLN